MPAESVVPDCSQTVGKLKVVLPEPVWAAIAGVVQRETGRASGADGDYLEFLGRLQLALSQRDEGERGRGGVWGYEGGFCRLAELLMERREWSAGRALVEAVSRAVCGLSAATARPEKPLPRSVMQAAEEAAQEMDEGTDRIVTIGRQPRESKTKPGKKPKADSRQVSLF